MEKEKLTQFLTTFLPLIAIFAVMYIFVIRPQNQKMKQLSQLISNLKIGDRVATSTGLMGVVKKIHETTLDLEIAPGVVIEMKKSYVNELIQNPESKNS